MIQPGIQGLASTPSWAVSPTSYFTDDTSFINFKITPLPDLSFRCTSCTLSLSFLFTRIWGDAPSRTNHFIAHLKAGTLIGRTSWGVKWWVQRGWNPGMFTGAENPGDPSRNRWWKEHTGKGWRETKGSKGKWEAVTKELRADEVTSP